MWSESCLSVCLSVCLPGASVCGLSAYCLPSFGGGRLFAFWLRTIWLISVCGLFAFYLPMCMRYI